MYTFLLKFYVQIHVYIYSKCKNMLLAFLLRFSPQNYRKHQPIYIIKARSFRNAYAYMQMHISEVRAYFEGHCIFCRNSYIFAYIGSYEYLIALNLYNEV